MSPLNKSFKPFAVLFVILFAAAGFLWYRAERKARAESPFTPDKETWRLKQGTFTDGSAVPEKGIPNEAFVEIPLRSAVTPGTYDLTIFYEAESGQSAGIVIDTPYDVFLESSEAILPMRKDMLVYSFEVTHALESENCPRLVIRYNGEGDFSVQNVMVRQSAASARKQFASMVILLIALLCAARVFSLSPSSRNTVLSVLAIALIGSLPSSLYGIHNGYMQDLPFHLNRIEAIAKGLKEFRIPVRVSTQWMDGYGYPSSVFYNDILMYIPGIFRLFGFSLLGSYKIYIFLIDLLTAWIACYSFSGIFRSRSLGIVLSAVYSFSNYRIENIYNRSAAGEYSAMAFLPLIALAIYRIYTMDLSAWKERRANALLLAAGYSGLIGTHLLSVLMVTFLLVLLCLVFFRKTFRKEILLTYLYAAGITLLVNFYFLVPFLDYYRFGIFRINETNQKSLWIQRYGLYPAQLFAVNKNFAGNALPDEIRACAPYTPGFLLMLTFLAGIRESFRKGSKRILFYTAFSALCLFLSTRCFPWDAISGLSFVGKGLSQIQFPWRFLAPGTLLLTLTLGELLSQSCEENALPWMRRGILLTCFLSICLFLGNYSDYMNASVFYDASGLPGNGFFTSEYELSGTDFKNTDGKLSSKNLESAAITKRYSDGLTVSLKNGSEIGSVTIPMFNYPGFAAKDEAGNSFRISDGPEKAISLAIPENYEGNITIRFENPILWTVSLGISFLTIIFLFLGKKRYHA